MLVWKTQTLNIDMASLRYRCLFPLRYLNQLGVSSVIFSGSDPVKLTANTQAIIFIKSFHPEDVLACEQAYQLGVPIILDLCDNIFIKDYAQNCSFVMSDNFLQMAQQATAIVTTGPAMKTAVEKALADCDRQATASPCRPHSGASDSDVSHSGAPNRAVRSLLPVVVIPDGSESISDIKYAFSVTRQQRIVKKLKSYLSLWQRVVRKVRQRYGQAKHKSKRAFYRIKGSVGRILRRYGLRLPLVVPPLTQSPVVIEQPKQAVKSQPIKSRPEPPPIWPQRWPHAAGVKTVLWFGNYGAKYGNFGMLNILDAAAALETLSQECPLRLMVVSNNRDRYEKHIAPLPFNTHYLQWHPRKIYEYIRASDVVIVPNSQSVYSICKSANRTVLSLSLGTPVVASYTPALDMLSACIWLDDWEAGLRAYLQDPEKGGAHVAIAQQIIARHLSGEVIARQWLSLLQEVASLTVATPPSDSQADSQVLA